MLHPSTKKLIDRLAEMTERGKLSWAESEAGPVYATEGYSVQLASASGDLVITSKDGKELERASAEELSATPSDHGDTYAGIVALMTKEAQRVARGTETAINSLLAGIDQDSDDTVEAAPVDIDAAPEESEIEAVVDDTQVVAADVPEIEAEAEPEATVEVEDAAPEAVSDIAAQSPETESDMQDAVARLANEVNNRSDMVAEPASEPAIEAAPTTPHKYVPFGLNGASDPSDAAGFVPISDTGIMDSAEEETDLAAEPEVPVADTQETPVFAAPEPAEEATAEAVEDHGFDAPATAPEFTAPIETVPEAPIAVDNAATDAASEQPQSFSLSGIGAGFGLGALTATTEATGAPSMTAPPEEEKIVIDATDDIPFTTPEQNAEPETGLPDVSTLEQPEAEAAPQPAEPQAPEQAEAEEATELKPRTRFNPWN